MAKNGKSYEAGGTAFLGCIVVGTGLGMAFGNVAVGSTIGVGAGFLVMAVFRAIGR